MGLKGIGTQRRDDAAQLILLMSAKVEKFDRPDFTDYRNKAAACV